MSVINILLPFTSAVISFVFAFLLFRRYLVRRGPHLLLWGIGMVFYGIGGFCEGYYGAIGWNPFIFRLWYLAGAILVAAWLGQGTVYLLAKRRWANVLMVLLALGSLYALIPSGLCIILIIIRTCFEDNTLHEELDGYTEYAQKTRFRLFPGIW